MDTTDVIAGYAAIVATSAFLWNIYKWITSGPRISFNAKSNMCIYGDARFPTDKTYISATATNNGDRPTSITNLGCYHYKNWFDRLRRKRNFQAVIGDTCFQPLPHVLKSGTIWKGLADQEDLEKKTLGKGILIFELWLSHKKRPMTVRVILKSKNNK